MTTEIDGNSSRSDITSIDDTDSPYTTQGEGTIAVDTSNGAVTVTLASADVKSGQPVEIYDSGNNAATNNITINTEGSETINPGAASSITLSTSGTYRKIKSDGSNWFAQVNAQRDVVSTDDTDSKVINGEIVYANHSDFSTVQDALDYANTNGHHVIWVEAGSYGSIDVYADQRVQGLTGGIRSSMPTFDGGTSDHAIDCQDNANITLQNLEAKTTAGGGNSFEAIHRPGNRSRVIDCWVSESDQHGIQIDQSHVVVRGCHGDAGSIDNNMCLLTSNSANCVIDGNTNWSVTDNGSNVVGDNS